MFILIKFEFNFDLSASTLPTSKSQIPKLITKLSPNLLHHVSKIAP